MPRSLTGSLSSLIIWVTLPLLYLSPSIMAQTYSGSTANGARFRRPNTGNPPTIQTTSSGAGSNVRYHAYTYMPLQSGRYRIVSTASPPWDNFLILYRGAFNATSPLTNVLAANDDFGDNTHAGIDAVPLTANQTYTIVTTGWSNTSEGSFTNTITLLGTTTATTGNPTFLRPLVNGRSAPNALSTTVSVPYAVSAFTPSQSGRYRLLSTSQTPGFDPFTLVYQNSFNASVPLTNALIANEDFAGHLYSGLELDLTGGTSYFLVTTGSTNDDFGAFTASFVRLNSAAATGTTQGQPTFQRPVPNGNLPPFALSATATVVPFEVQQVRVSVTGLYSFTCTSLTAGYDTFTALYHGAFFAGTSLNNCLIANDDKEANGVSGFDLVYLEANETYLFVTTGYANDHAGEYHLDVSGPGAITISLNVTVTGTITLEECQNSEQEVRFEFRPDDNSGTFTRTTVLNPDGSFALPDIPLKSYQVQISASNWLSSTVAIGGASGVTSVNALLRGGDANEDNSIDVLDLAALIQGFDRCNGDEDYDPAADFNCDDCVDVIDLDILIRNFDASGDP